jgi:hypothetical protein
MRHAAPDRVKCFGVSNTGSVTPRHEPARKTTPSPSPKHGRGDNRPNGQSVRLSAATRNHRIQPVECSSARAAVANPVSVRVRLALAVASTLR